MKVLTFISWILLATVAAAQQQEPQVRVNIMNVCTPGDTEQKEIAAALARIPRRPAFAADFEVARGLSTSAEAAPSRWVRIRHEFGEKSPFVNAQYSFSADDKASIETLVLRLRDPKDLMQISIDTHTPGSDWKGAITGDQDAGRVKLELFGKPSVGLARCEGANQTAYDPLFRSASEVLRQYRARMNTVATVLGELPKISASSQPVKKPATKKPATKKPATKKPATKKP